MAELTSWWVVAWEDDGLPYLFDTDDGIRAHEIAWRMAEAGRANVHVSEIECEIPPEAQERIRERVMRAVVSEQSMALLEAAQ